MFHEYVHGGSWRNQTNGNNNKQINRGVLEATVDIWKSGWKTINNFKINGILVCIVIMMDNFNLF